MSDNGIDGTEPITRDELIQVVEETEVILTEMKAVINVHAEVLACHRWVLEQFVPGPMFQAAVKQYYEARARIEIRSEPETVPPRQLTWNVLALNTEIIINGRYVRLVCGEPASAHTAKLLAEMWEWITLLFRNMGCDTRTTKVGNQFEFKFQDSQMRLLHRIPGRMERFVRSPQSSSMPRSRWSAIR
jgi:hypothetical protein